MAGLAAAGVDDAAAVWPPSRPERQPAFVVEVEDDAARLQVADRGRRLLDQHPHRGGAAEAAAGGDRVGGVAPGRVARFERRRQPALGPEAGALGERRARDDADAAALLGGAQRGPEAGGAAADDGDVVLGAAAIAAQPLGGSCSSCSRSQAAAPSRARARSSATALSAAAARCSAACDPLLGGVGLGFDLAQPLLGGGDRLLLAPRARAAGLPRGASRSCSQIALGLGARPLEVGLERLDLGLGALLGRGCASSAAATSRRSASSIRALDAPVRRVPPVSVLIAGSI